MIRFIVLLLALVFCTPIWAQKKFVGTAYSSPNKQKLVYKEQHKVQQNKDGSKLTETIYFDPKGKKIASLTCNYKTSDFVPDFEFNDYRTGYWEKLNHKENGGFVVEYRENNNAEIVKKEFTGLSQLAASQGLNELIRNHIDKLANGKDIVTRFLLPSRMTEVNMLITGEQADENKVNVQIKLKNPILRIFAPTLKMTYHKDNGDLLNYYGNSNLVTDSGENQKVYIEYDYGNIKVASNKKSKDE